MNSRRLAIAGCLLCLFMTPESAVAQSLAPSITVNAFDTAGELTNSQVFSGLKLAFLLSSLVFLPSLLMTVTCFMRLSIVLSLTRQALGTAQTPPNQIILGLALFLTFAIMGPIFNQIYNDAVVPYTDDQISTTEALQKTFAPLRTFMLKHTREEDLQLFLDVQKLESPQEPEDLSATVVVPAFVVSELNTAFQISFLIFLPFLILDMIISSILTSMSMITLPPTVISLPIKLMLFVIIDGWHLIIGNLVQSYQV
ncbi:MAG: flagellar type III secretion system pore protein FliP [bacterium]|nr:flagellar type III secretion system pore protein FliP [bacterium]